MVVVGGVDGSQSSAESAVVATGVRVHLYSRLGFKEMQKRGDFQREL